MAKTIYHYSCLKGVDSVSRRHQADLRQKLMEIFGNPCRTTYLRYLQDYRSIPYEQKLQIDKLFKDVFQMEPDQVWDITVTEED